MNILDYAMKMELDGKAFYEKLAAECSSEGLRNIFTELAHDEQKHYDIFRKLKDQKAVGAMSDSTALEGARSLFADMQADQASRDLLKSNLDGYRYAMKAEQESADLYLKAAEQEDDREAKALLQKIAVEEQKHLKILENAYDFVNAPERPLVWGEWSNLDTDA